MDRIKLQQAIDWLIDGALSAVSPASMMAESCQRLAEAGLPLWRVSVVVQTLHPEVFGRSFVWRPGADVIITPLDFGAPDSLEYRRSPLFVLNQTSREVRYRLDDPETARFPFFDDMRTEGVTDYLALPLKFSDGVTHSSSFTTREPGGFSAAHLDALRSASLPLTRVIEITILRRTALSLLDLYVGDRAGERIWGGQIRRGHTETMHAAIWLSDLRGFTALSDRLPPEQVVDILNGYFDCQVPAIREQGGEVLKFMGDGLLAVFPIAATDGDLAEVCARVLKAARQSRASVAALRVPIGVGIEHFRFGVALHVGRILYGNIGGGGRLDFTCIGPAVNLAARLEKMASRLNRTILASADFAGSCADDWTDLGEFPIAGFAKAERVFGLADEAPAG